MHRHRQHVADAQPGMGLVGGLAVDADRASGHQRGAVAALTHEPGAPEPLVEALPVAVLRSRRWRPPLALQRRQRGEWAMRVHRGAAARRPGAAAAAAAAWPAPEDRVRPPPGPRPARPGNRDGAAPPEADRPSARTAMPGPPAWRSPRDASPRPVRRRPARRCRAAAAPGRPPASPWHRRNRRASPAGSGTETTSGGGSSGTATPCCTPHSRARMAAARGFSSAGRNRPKRPAFTPIAFSAARACGDSVSPSSPAIRPSASVSRCSRPRNSDCVPPRPASGEQRRQIVAHPIVHEALQPDAQPLALRAVEELAVQHLHARSQRAGAAPQPGDRHAVPDQRAGRRRTRRRRPARSPPRRRGAASPRAAPAERRAARGASRRPRRSGRERSRDRRCGRRGGPRR